MVPGMLDGHGARPLADIRVIAVEQFGAGPWATLQLADLGAEVIKLEDPATRGDVARYVPPYSDGEDSLYFESFNRSKRSVSLDLRTDAGRTVFERLVRESDAVFCNLRGDLPERLGLTYDALKGVNPRIVCCALSGFGRTGPRAGEPAYDYVLQAMAGWMSLTGEPDGPPVKSGLSLVDFAGGYVAALALLAGVWRARRDGAGCDCDTSLFDTALSLLSYVGTWAASRGHVGPRLPESAHPSIVPFQAFETADGWITVACPKQKFWLALCRALDRPDLAGDPRLASFTGRFEHRDELLAQLRPLFRERPSAEILARLAAAGVPSGPVNDVLSALDDEQAQARGAVVAYDHPRLGPVRQVATPLRLDGPPPEYRPAPSRGEDTLPLLRELCGYGEDDLERLRAAGAFGHAGG
jgi:crotonobetainyl-CoA:carnitine CoA-transferase CaiB-like acyl-CoA transferase